ncbi:glycosyltransferase family 4 protein [Moritella sp. 24]|uniref:glycosyltransferase family 4 protein n=1 Tax=Moritella sp. 24 TaxID=2746230 RepID=UPI001BABF1A3|nr:glycosyltransferase family 4 protein [Moritella sp. 24]QUM75957.1 glycosyltransferase family 4 protein [Moritella sp. 24]
MINVCHLTSVHPRYDTRIFIKMCTSLADNGYVVSLIVADGLGNEVKNNVHIVDVGKNTGSRISRMTKTVALIFDKALEQRARIYHLHDPELMPLGLKLKQKGFKVIFDAHEDLPLQLLSKPYLSKYSARILSKFVKMFERYYLSKFDAVIAATQHIAEKFSTINNNTIDINNYPIIDEFNSKYDGINKLKQVTYVGGITKVRGIVEIVNAMGHVNSDIVLSLAGTFFSSKLREEVVSLNGWSRVDEKGWLGRNEISRNLKESIAGIVTLHPIINYQDALPVKMFEYMAAGIPVIASNIPLWNSIISKANCGICVDPFDINEIVTAINYLSENESQAMEMGSNGRKAVLAKYNWAIEEEKLLYLYTNL